MEVYKDEAGSFQIKGDGFEANSNYIQDALLPPKVTVNINGNESPYYQKINGNVPPFCIWMFLPGIVLGFLNLIDEASLTLKFDIFSLYQKLLLLHY